MYTVYIYIYVQYLFIHTIYIYIVKKYNVSTWYVRNYGIRLQEHQAPHQPGHPGGRKNCALGWFRAAVEHPMFSTFMGFQWNM